MTPYRIFFEMKHEPFAADLDLEHILATPALKAVSERVRYAMNIGAMALVTGEIGSGKSTALRYVTEKLHPSEYRPLYIIATTGAISELYRQLLHARGAIIVAAKNKSLTVTADHVRMAATEIF